MKGLIQDNKGVVLIVVLALASIAVVMSMSFLAAGIQESNLSQRYRNSVAAFYEAEAGINYAFTELRNAGWSWFTHQVSQVDENNNTNPNYLLKVSSSVGYTLSGTINPSGCYQLTTPGGLIEVKTYREPGGADIFILSRSSSSTTNSEKILRLKVSERSLYAYFIFSPFSFSLYSIDGKGVGGVHSNDNIYWASSRQVTNVTEVSAADFMRYNYDRRVPAYLLDGLDGVMDGKAPQPEMGTPTRAWKPSDYDDWFNVLSESQQAQALAAGVTRPSETPRPNSPVDYPWLKLYWNSEDPLNAGYIWHPDWDSIKDNWDTLRTNQGTSYSWNETPASYTATFPPNSETSPFWNQPETRNFEAYKASYSSLDELFGQNMTINGVLVPETLSSVAGATGYLYDQFYSDPYVDGGTDGYGSGTIPTVYYTNTELLPAAWNTWVINQAIPEDQPNEGQPLSTVLKEKGTGGKFIDPVSVRSDYYKDLARNGGIYINYDGTTNRADLDEDIITTDSISSNQFYNQIRPSTTPGGMLQLQKDKVITIDVEELKDWAEEKDFNGVIYYDGNKYTVNMQGQEVAEDQPDRGLRLKNAKELPGQTDSNSSGGLTVFSTRQVYLQGDFNYDSSKELADNDEKWQPAAVVTTNLVYYLSSAFDNPDTAQPALVHNLNYPWVRDDPNYWGQNQSSMPNEAEVDSRSKAVTYRVSVVSTRDLWDDNILERWREGKEGAEYIRKFIGARVQIPGRSTSIPANYSRGRNWPGDPPYLRDYRGASSVFEYDPKLGERTPPGDFLGGTQEGWLEVSNFYNHT